ncbi:hypothetical protein CRM81_05605 [Yersinia kristensenii]|nr:hypothetical protein CRM81_05605 [Yersinia kristensenii]
MCVSCFRSPQSLTRVSSWGFAQLLPSCNSNYLGYGNKNASHYLAGILNRHRCCNATSRVANTFSTIALGDDMAKMLWKISAQL